MPQLPPLDSLYRCVDQYFAELTIAQTEELKEQRKGRWLDYLPSPGYSPFQGGFTLSMNLAAPLGEIKMARQQKLKLQSIRSLNAMDCAALKSAVTADYKSLQDAVQEYAAKDTVQRLKQTAYNLYRSQYDRNEMTPSEFLGKQQEWEMFKIQRLSECNALRRSLVQLLLKAKAAIASNDDGH